MTSWGRAARGRPALSRRSARGSCGWTERASAPRVPRKPLPPSECEIPRRAYRGCGGHGSLNAGPLRWGRSEGDCPTCLSGVACRGRTR
ncbi:hypothetical protein GKQ77_06530 [Streptomyces sp. BG9H]|uniref:Uncharacterized protein n=1 Tax=Streptomyces anatolicus TaxID=2675858 RepID=A0ABS6YIJ2_9ACTN|nr:hypothetical protein [Streptomyces anatolicus]